MSTRGKKRFLLVIWDGGGTIPPELGVAKRLIARGHSVHVLGEHPSESDALTARCSFSEYRRAPNRESRREEHDPFRDWEGSPLAAFKRARDAMMCGPARAFADDVLEVIDEQGIDAVIVDSFLLGAVIGAEKSGLPSAGLMPNILMRPGPGSTPLGMGFKPAAGPLGRLRDRFFNGMMMRMFASGHAPIAAARRGLGLQPVAHPFDLMDRLDKLLLLSTREFDFERQILPENVRYVGPQLDDPSWAAPWQSRWPADSAEPLVLVSMGTSFQNQSAATQRIIDAVGTMPVRAVVTLGDVFDPAHFSSPDNVVVVKSAPHAQVLKQTSAVITHGGHGTVMKALAADMPILCIPHGRDQNDNAARLQVHGTGVQVKPSASSKTIRAALERLLADPDFAVCAATMGQRVRASMEGDRAVAELEALFEDNSTSAVSI